jgi:drug/metabolite transporter (DMT)-like permease
MMAFALHRGAKLPALRDWLRVAPAGVLLFVGGNGFVSIASQSLTSGGIAVVCATMPLWVGVLGYAIGERPTAREWLSLFVGFIGVLVLMGSPSLSGKPIHVALVIGSPILWAAGSLLARRTKDVGGAHGALVGPSVQMLTGGVALAVIGLVRGERIRSMRRRHRGSRSAICGCSARSSGSPPTRGCFAMRGRSSRRATRTSIRSWRCCSVPRSTASRSAGPLLSQIS